MAELSHEEVVGILGGLGDVIIAEVIASFCDPGTRPLAMVRAPIFARPDQPVTSLWGDYAN